MLGQEISQRLEAILINPVIWSCHRVSLPIERILSPILSKSGLSATFKETQGIFQVSLNLCSCAKDVSSVLEWKLPLVLFQFDDVSLYPTIIFEGRALSRDTSLALQLNVSAPEAPHSAGLIGGAQVVLTDSDWSITIELRTFPFAIITVPEAAVSEAPAGSGIDHRDYVAKAEPQFDRVLRTGFCEEII